MGTHIVLGSEHINSLSVRNLLQVTCDRSRACGKTVDPQVTLRCAPPVTLCAQDRPLALALVPGFCRFSQRLGTFQSSSSAVLDKSVLYMMWVFLISVYKIYTYI